MTTRRTVSRWDTHRDGTRDVLHQSQSQSQSQSPLLEGHRSWVYGARPCTTYGPPIETPQQAMTATTTRASRHTPGAAMTEHTDTDALAETGYAQIPVGLVTAIHDALCSQRSNHGTCDPLDYDHTAYDAAAAVLASDWLAARVDAARRDADAQIAAVRALADEWETPGMGGVRTTYWRTSAALRAALAVSDPTPHEHSPCWRGECFRACYYPDTCSEQP